MKSLRIPLCFSITLATLASSGCAGHSANKKKATLPTETPQVTLEIEIIPAVVQATQNMDLRIRMRNLAQRPVPFTESSNERDFTFDLRDAEGKAVALTPQAQSARQGVFWRLFVTSLPAGGAWQTSVPLRSIFMVDQPGTYTLTVSREFTYNTHEPAIRVQSNPATLQVESPAE